MDPPGQNPNPVDVAALFGNPHFRSNLSSYLSEIVDGKIRIFVDDRINESFRFRVPDQVEAILARKLPMHVENYFCNHKRTQDILELSTKKLEDETRKTLMRVSNEDPYQNAVFGPFMENLENRSLKTLDEIKRESLSRISSLEKWQMINTFLNVGALTLAVYVWTKTTKEKP